MIRGCVPQIEEGVCFLASKVELFFDGTFFVCKLFRCEVVSVCYFKHSEFLSSCSREILRICLSLLIENVFFVVSNRYYVFHLVLDNVAAVSLWAAFSFYCLYHNNINGLLYW